MREKENSNPVHVLDMIEADDQHIAGRLKRTDFINTRNL